MRRLGLALVLMALAACGSDVPTARTAEISRQNEQARLAAQEGRIDNPEVLACIAAATTPEERAILAEEGEAGALLLRDVVNRDEMRRCMAENNVVVYL
jgi:hypothetical protein